MVRLSAWYFSNPEARWAGGSPLIALRAYPGPSSRRAARLDREVIEDRSERASTLIASQLPATDWHGAIGDPNQADAILDPHNPTMDITSMRNTFRWSALAAM